jgi:hypothetical protein
MIAQSIHARSFISDSHRCPWKAASSRKPLATRKSMTRAPANSFHPSPAPNGVHGLPNIIRREPWLVTYKKATGKPRVEYEESVEEALCFG